MESAAEEICLQKLEELVFDEDKIVTISLACQKLDVSVLEAKELLKKFVSDQKINPGKISVTYLISGKLKKKGEFSIEIVDGTDLKEKKKQFDSITDKVVYSVQKHNVIDFNLIALSEKSDDGYFRAAALKGSIVSEKCIERDIKTKELPPLPPPKNFEKQKPSSFFKAVPKEQTNGEKEKTTVKESVKEVKKQAQKKTGGLANFLSQTKENPSKVKNERSDEDERDSKRARIESNDSEGAKDKKLEIKDEKIVKKEEPKKAAKNKKTKKDSDKNNDKDGKKRKRIIVESDSDDDIFGNAEEEGKMEVVESDEDSPVAVKPKEPAVPVPKNKRRKAVEKTYEDEEGYIVTRTEYVLVSASEDEEENVEPPKKEIKVVPKTQPKEERKISPVKGAKKKGKAVAANQPTLMNFFKKK